MDDNTKVEDKELDNIVLLLCCLYAFKVSIMSNHFDLISSTLYQNNISIVKYNNYFSQFKIFFNFLVFFFKVFIFMTNKLLTYF